MKNNNLFYKVLSYICIVLFLSIFILFVLGRFNRVGYLSDFKLINEVNGVYNYNFRINYYSKIFRNNDIYGVYLNTNEVIKNNNFIKEISFLEKGSPFGNLLSSKEINEEKIDNIKYNLSIKYYVFLIWLISFVLLFIICIYAKVYIIVFFNERKKLLLKVSSILLIFISSILLLLFLLSNINYKTSLEDLELITESKAGYVYKAKLKSRIFFSPNIIYKYSNKPLKLENKPDYIKNYGYNIEINRIPDWYDSKIGALVWSNDDGSFTVSNSTSWNGYGYDIITSEGEKYKISIEIKKIFSDDTNPIKYHLDLCNTGLPIYGTDAIDTIYKVYSSEIVIKNSKRNEFPHFDLYFPRGVFSVKYIKIEQLSDNLYLKNDNSIVFTSYKKIDKLNDFGNVIYKLEYNKKLLVTIFILLILLIFKNIIYDFFKFIRSKVYILNRYIYILIIFLSFLIMPNIIYNIFYDKFDHTNYENRTLSIKPSLSLTNILNYPSEYEKYFNDNISFRNELVKFKNILDVIVFHYTMGDSLLGKDNWLFRQYSTTRDQFGDPLKFYMGLNYYSNEQLSNIKNAMISVKEFLYSKGIDFYIFIAPEQREIYYEYMPSYISKSVSNRTEFLFNYLKNDLNIIYPKEYFLANKDKYKLYYKYDLHWNAMGAFLGTQKLLELMNKETNDVVQLKIFSNVTRANASTLLLQDYFNDDFDYTINEDIYNKIIFNYDKKIGDGISTFYSYNPMSEDKRKLLIMGDSFHWELYRHISSYFSEVYSIPFWNFSHGCIDIIEPDIVVFIMMEYRELNGYYNFFFYNN